VVKPISDWITGDKILLLLINEPWFEFYRNSLLALIDLVQVEKRISVKAIPANLSKYSMVNQEMHTASTKANLGLSDKSP